MPTVAPRVENCDKKRVHIDIDRKLWHAFKLIAYRDGQTLTERLHALLRRETGVETQSRSA